MLHAFVWYSLRFFFAPFDFAKEGKTENKTAASQLGTATSMMVGRVRDLSSEVRSFAAQFLVGVKTNKILAARSLKIV